MARDFSRSRRPFWMTSSARRWDTCHLISRKCFSSDTMRDVICDVMTWCCIILYDVTLPGVRRTYRLWPVKPGISYGHMGGMRLRTNFAAESNAVTWSCGDRSVSKETYCVAYNLTGVWRIMFQPQRPLRQFLTAGLRQLFCLIRRTHRTAVHSMWPLLLKRYQSKM